MTPPPPRSTLFPYTTLFRSLNFHPLELAPETEVEIHFLRRLRGEIKFPSVDALRQQIAHDVHHARRYFRSEEHTSELQSQFHLVCRLLLEKKKTKKHKISYT